MKLIIAVLSCQRNVQERKAIRDTWKKECAPLGVDFTFLLGSEKFQIINDMTCFQCKDDYKNLPAKIDLFCKMLNKTMFDYIFKCDDDTYVNVPRLKEFVDSLDKKKYHFIGRPAEDRPIVACGGAGYIISTRAASLINIQHTGSEDINVSRCLYDNGIYLTKTDRLDSAHFGIHEKIPLPSNDQISTHYIHPDGMKLLYDIEKNWSKEKVESTEWLKKTARIDEAIGKPFKGN